MSDTTTTTTRTVTLDIGGMTCASCAARITKRLNKLDGVDAAVNYATEQATVTVPDDMTIDQLVGQVEGLRQHGRPPAASSSDTTDDGDQAETTQDPELAAL